MTFPTSTNPVYLSAETSSRTYEHDTGEVSVYHEVHYLVVIRHPALGLLASRLKSLSDKVEAYRKEQLLRASALSASRLESRSKAMEDWVNAKSLWEKKTFWQKAFSRKPQEPLCYALRPPPEIAATSSLCQRIGKYLETLETLDLTGDFAEYRRRSSYANSIPLEYVLLTRNPDNLDVSELLNLNPFQNGIL